MTLKDKAKTYNFWISIVSAAVLIARIIGDKFNIFIDTTLIMDITTGLCSIFVVLGILSAPKSISQNKITLPQDSLTQTNTTVNQTKAENNQNNATNQSSNQIDTYNIGSSFENGNVSAGIIEASITTNLETNNQPIKQTETKETDLKTVLEIIENLRAEIYKKNSTVDELNKFNQ